MKTLLSILAVCAAANFSAPLRAEEFVVYKSKLKLPITYVTNASGVDKVVTLTLTGDDLVNITLGRQLGTPVDKVKQILALAGSAEGNIGMVGPKSHLIIYDFELHQPAAGTTHLADVSSLSFQTAYRGPAGDKGFGSAEVKLLAHTAAVADLGTIFASTLAGAATAGGPSKFNGSNGPFNVNLKGGITSGAGRVHVKFTDKNGVVTEVNGFLLNGTCTVSGLSIDSFTE